MENLDEAVAVGPTDPHALAYRAVVASTAASAAERAADVAADLEAFATLNDQPADLVAALVSLGLLDG